jgi:nucleotide-binding universal stress UspA family protein
MLWRACTVHRPAGWSILDQALAEPGDTMPKSRILIATDLSPRSDRHTERGIALAQDMGCEPVIVHVVEGGLTGDAHEMPAIRRGLVSDYGAEAAAWEVRLGEGPVPDKIAEAAMINDALLIVVGVARFNNLRDYVLGTAVDYLVRMAPVPVLVVKRRVHQSYRRIAVATDFSECSAAALAATLTLFPQARIELVHMSHAPFNTQMTSGGVPEQIPAGEEAEMRAFLARLDLSDVDAQRICPQVIAGDLEAGLCDWIVDTEADMLALGTHGRSGLAHAVIGSMASRLLKTAPVDVLMVRKPG